LRVAEVCNAAHGSGMGVRLRGDEADGKMFTPGVYDPTFWTWSLHFTNSMGVRTKEVQAPEIPPAATRPVMERLSDDEEWKRLKDLKRSCARLYARKRVAFSAMAPMRGGESP